MLCVSGYIMPIILVSRSTHLDVPVRNYGEKKNCCGQVLYALAKREKLFDAERDTTVYTYRLTNMLARCGKVKILPHSRLQFPQTEIKCEIILNIRIQVIIKIE